MFKVTKKALVKLFVDLGFPTATKWAVSRLQTKVEGLPDIIDEDTDAGESQELLDNLLVALDNEDEISVQEKEDASPEKEDASPEKEDASPEKETFTAGPEDPETEPPKSKPKSTDNGKPKKVGVIASIVEILSAASETNPISKENLLHFLEKRFPERESKAMVSTISTQVPSRLKSAKGIIVSKDNEGGWWIE